MGATYELRKIVTKQLKDIEKLHCNVNYGKPKNKKYPCCCYEFYNIGGHNYPAEEWLLLVTVINKAETEDLIDEIAEQIKEKFDFYNEPTGNILPTFYFKERGTAENEDKELQVREIKVKIVCYTERGE